MQYTVELPSGPLTTDWLGKPGEVTRTMGDRIEMSYDGMWGELMAFTHDRDYLESVNRGRADWLESHGFGSGLRILDLGCGNGYLDLELARRGHRVVAVDHVPRVIEAARRHAEDGLVTFIASDLRDLTLPEASFDVVLAFGLVGLMSVSDDARLFTRARCWLTAEGSMLVETDLNLAPTQTIEASHPDGTISWHWSSDETTRTNILVPELHRRDGAVVGLRDPIDPSRGDHPGLRRYIYPPSELAALVEDAGFAVTRIGHFLEFVFPQATPDRYMLLARAIQPPSARLPR